MLSTLSSRHGVATLVTNAARFTLGVTICLAVFSHRADAGSFYYEFAGGLTKFQQASPFFGNSAESSTGMGYTVNNAVLVGFGGDKRAFAFHFGLQHRLSSAADQTYNYGFMTTYPVMRLQFSRVYLSFGYTPIVFRRVGGAAGIEDYGRVRGATSMLAELGVLFPITKKFSLGTTGGMQFIRYEGAQSPKPAIDGTVSMRFYFGFFSSGGGDSSSGEFKGWRYPFGFIR